MLKWYIKQKSMEFQIVYYNNKSEKVSFPGRQSLINELFNGNSDQYKAQVKRLSWSTLAMKYVEDVKTGKIEAEITSADINPFGRN